MNAAATLAMSVFLIPALASAAPGGEPDAPSVPAAPGGEPDVPAAPGGEPEAAPPPAPEVATVDPDEPARPLTPPALALPSAPPPVTDVPAQPSRSPLEVRARTPNGGRGLAQYTALTVPEGTVDVSARGALPLGGLIAIAAGIASGTELSAEAGVAHENADTAAVVGVGFKQVIARARRAQLSLGGALRHIRDTGAELTLGQMGGTLTLCPDAGCGLMMSVGVSGLYVREEDDVRVVVSVGFSAGSRHRRFIGEVLVVAGTELVLGGMRLGNARYAADLGVASQITSDGGAMPFAGFAVRM